MRQARLDPSRTNWPVRGPAANHLDDYGGTAVLTGCSDSRVQGEKLKNTQPLMVCRCLVWVASCLVLQLSFHFRCMWEYTTSAHGLPIGAFFRGKSARNAYRRNEDYSITKGNSTVVLVMTKRPVEGRNDIATAVEAAFRAGSDQAWRYKIDLLWANLYCVDQKGFEESIKL